MRKKIFTTKLFLKKIPDIIQSKSSVYLLSIFFALIIVFYLYDQYNPPISQIGNNLITEILGAMITIILFTIVIEINEIVKWKKVEKKVYKRLSYAFITMYDHLSYLCDNVYKYQDKLDSYNCENDIENLELNLRGYDGDNLNFLTKKEHINFNEIGENVLLGIDECEGMHLDRAICYEYTSTYKDYSNFFKSSVSNSIFEIEDNLNHIFWYLNKLHDCQFRDIDEKRKQIYFDIMKEKFANIFKEIQNLQEVSGLNIFTYYQS